MSQARYICKQCGAESPVGIGYVLGPGEKPDGRVPSPGCPGPHVVNDTAIVDAIATYLGTWETWDGADALDTIAGLVGQVRPDPGATPAFIYARRFKEHTGRSIDETHNMEGR